MTRTCERCGVVLEDIVVEACGYKFCQQECALADPRVPVFLTDGGVVEASPAEVTVRVVGGDK